MPHQRDRNAIASPSRHATAGHVRFAIKLAWDGTEFQGFQSQVHGNTIQDQVERRLVKMVRRPLRVFGWGRTDSGVHAQGAVITVDLTREEVTRIAANRMEATVNSTDDTTKDNIDKDNFLKSRHVDKDWNNLAAKSLHSALKEFSCEGGGIVGSITALSVQPVPWDFDARFSSRWKRYVYYISSGSNERSPFLNRFAWQMDRHLDVNKMNQAANLLSNGPHNFEWLSVHQKGEARDPIRNVQIKVECVDSGSFLGIGSNRSVIKISGTCDFFLYRMMRRIAAVLVSIGSDTSSCNQLQEILEVFDKRKGSNATKEIIPSRLRDTAPAKGLCLEHIEYDIPI